MRILVGVKRVVDYAVKVRVAADKTGVDLGGIKMSMNPFCEIAVEEAIRLKEKNIANEVVVLSIGPKAAQETIRTALAMGADRGVHILTDKRLDQDMQPHMVARLFEKVCQDESPDLILLGKQSIDSDCAQTGPLLAGLLGWPQATFAAKLDIDGNKLTVERETDSGTETLTMSKPAVVTTDLRLNEPRYAKLPNIMKAKKKKIDVIEESAIDLGALSSPPPPAPYTVLSVEEPPPRKGGSFVESVDELLDKLRNEAKVI